MIEQLALVAVGSLNPVKVGAVRAALAPLAPVTVRGVAVPSGVPAMPVGVAEMTAGAVTRARAARTTLEASWGIGLEGGVEFGDDGSSWLLGVVAIVTSDGFVSLAQSSRVLLPPAIAARVRAGAELGPLMDEILGERDTKQKLGAVGFLTRGLLTREESWRVAVLCALAPLLHPDLYAAEEL